jgi:hypothetical protein
MGAVEAFGEDWETVSQSLDASAIYLLSRDTTPEEAITEAIQAAEAGERASTWACCPPAVRPQTGVGRNLPVNFPECRLCNLRRADPTVATLPRELKAG